MTFNAGDRAKWEQFIANHCPTKSPQSIEQDLGFRAQAGGLDLFKVEESSDTRAVALLKPGDAETTGIRVTSRSGPRSPITSFGWLSSLGSAFR